MSGTAAAREIEIKLAMSSAVAARKLLRSAGFRPVRRRLLETNVLFDNALGELRSRRCLLRLRRTGRRTLLTYKGTPEPGPHKSREELELAIPDAATFQAILERLGLHPVFRYEKYRTEYRRPGGAGLVTLDETPVGVYLEIEGGPAWIDATARKLGFAESDYILASYATLYLEFCARRNVPPGNMTFS